MKAIVLAAGRSSRFWPLAQEGHKSTYCVGYGRPVIEYTLEGLKRSGIKEEAVVRAPIDPSLAKCLINYQNSSGTKISSFEQAGAGGMGDAILSAEEFLNGLKDDEHFLVLNASQININEIWGELRSKMLEGEGAWSGNTLFGQRTDHPENFGIMSIGQGGRVLEIIEKPKVFVSPIRIVGAYVLNKSFLRELENHSGEYSLEETLQALVERGENLQAIVLPQEMPLFSLKYPWDLLAMNWYLMKKETLFGANSYPIVKDGVRLVGDGIVFGSGVTIYENAVIKGPCFIDKGAVIGNHALVRDCSYVGKNVVVGAHSEVKNSILYDNVELHRNFVGDSILDHDCSLGAGTITANKRIDRKNIKVSVDGKHVDTGLRGLGVMMGDRVKVGINLSLMPGVMIERGTEIFPVGAIDQSYINKLNY